jgi:hypothetical protein
METDVSPWDWSVKDWMLYTEIATRLAMFTEMDDTFSKIAYTRCYYTSYSVYVLSDGNAYYLPQGGVQLSGSYLTSSGNSRMRIQLSIHSKPYAGAIAMGDDCIDSHSIATVCKDLGIKLKFESPCTNVIDFCSHEIHLDHDRNYITHYPTNPGKSMCRLLSYKPQNPLDFVTPIQMLTQFVDFVRHHPNKDKFMEEILEDDYWRNVYNLTQLPKLGQLHNFCQMTNPRVSGSRNATKQSGLLSDKILIEKIKVRDPTKSNKSVPTKSKKSFSMKGMRPTWKETTIQTIEPRVGLANRVSTHHEKFKVKAIHNGIAIRGSVLLTELYSQSVVNGAAISNVIPLHPKTLNSWQLSRMA